MALMFLRALPLAMAAVSAQQPQVGGGAPAPNDDHLLEYMRRSAALASTHAPHLAPEGQVQAEAPQPQEKAVERATATAPASPEACRTRGELDAWWERKSAELRAFVPAASLGFAFGDWKLKYDKRLAELDAGRQPRAREHSGGGLQLPAPASDRWAYLLQHAGDFGHCTQLRVRVQLGRGAVEFPVLLATAEMCQTERELRTWRACQLAEVRDNVPQRYQAFALDVLRAQFEQRLAVLASEGGPGIGAAPASLPRARLAAAAPQLPAFLAVAALCSSEPELRAWHAHELARLGNIVPRAYQGFAASILERTFQQQLVQVTAAAARDGEAATAEAAGQPVPSTAAASLGEQREAPPTEAMQRLGLSGHGAALELAAEGTGVGHLHLKPTVLILGGLALPALLAFAARVTSCRRRRLTENPMQENAPQGRELRELGACPSHV